jgi:hypothetical protein
MRFDPFAGDRSGGSVWVRLHPARTACLPGISLSNVSISSRARGAQRGVGFVFFSQTGKLMHGESSTHLWQTVLQVYLYCVAFSLPPGFAPATFARHAFAHTLDMVVWRACGGLRHLLLLILILLACLQVRGRPISGSSEKQRVNEPAQALRRRTGTRRLPGSTIKEFAR